MNVGIGNVIEYIG